MPGFGNNDPRCISKGIHNSVLDKSVFCRVAACGVRVSRVSAASADAACDAPTRSDSTSSTYSTRSKGREDRLGPQCLAIGEPSRSSLAESARRPPTNQGFRKASMSSSQQGKRTGVAIMAVICLATFCFGERRNRLEIEKPITEEDRNHWAFQPIRAMAPPSVIDDSKIRNGVDHFILSRLEVEGLSLMPAADRRTLIRRLSFDLRGLPPTPDEVQTFLEDESDFAYEALIDRFLADPAYGERWAQHWLDVARFAESDGFEHDQVREDAWRYRDWVINSLNADMPYDEFVRLQIAGDELYPDDESKAIATGFLVSGPDMPDINLDEERAHTVLNEMTSSTGLAFMGLTLECAQCHEHKSDPISIEDYYRLRAVFANMEFPKKNKQLSHIFLENDAEAPPSFVMKRGDFRSPGDPVEPAFIRVVNAMGMQVGSGNAESTTTGRRKALAEWLTLPGHPLTARVIVNRLWQHHFGSPIVGTPNDFGVLGDRPTHPELLDWLASELIDGGWSLKEMHRLMLQSATYRQVSRPVGDSWKTATKKDPDNLLYSRMNRKRLEGEAIRDAILSVSGQLNRKRGGPGVHPPLPQEVAITLIKKQWEVSEDVSEHTRRSIYLFTRRNLRFPIFDVFDRPDANASCGRRNVSTTAPQSLTLLNSEFSMNASRHLAGMLINVRPNYDREAWVRRAYEIVFSREETNIERQLGLSFLNDQVASFKAEGRQVGTLAMPVETSVRFDPYEGAALVDYCLALFNLNEMIYLD